MTLSPASVNIKVVENTSGSAIVSVLNNIVISRTHGDERTQMPVKVTIAPHHGGDRRQ